VNTGHGNHAVAFNTENALADGLTVAPWLVAPGLVELDGVLLSGRIRAAHELREASPIGIISGRHGGLEVADNILRGQPTQLSPHRNGGPSNLLKLADAPKGSPGHDALGNSLGVVAVLVNIDAESVDVLADVLGDVAGGGATVPIDGHDREPVLARAPLVAIDLKRVVLEYLAKLFLMLSWHE
jgi:hypothetical protein